LAIESKLSKKEMLLTEGMPIIKIKTNMNIEALTLLNLNLSIKEDTGISNSETIDVIAAKYANPKNKIAINLPMAPYWPKPVGMVVNKVPIVLAFIELLKLKV